MASVIISATLILRDSGVVPSHPMDQHFVESVDLAIRYTKGNWTFHYPALQNSGGITSSLIAGIYKLIIPTSKTNLNWHIRILAMVMYLGSSWWMIRSLISAAPIRILAYLLICISGFQFIQPSSDLFAGSFFNLSLVALRQAWPVLITSLLLAIFGLTKVDMIVAAIMIAVLWGFWEQQKGRQNPERLALFTFGWLLLFLAPAFLIQGSDPLAGNRSLLAFMSAYTEFLGYHQFTGIPAAAGIDTMKIAKEAIFPGVNNLLDIVTKYPQLYFDFVAVSAARSLPNVIHAGKLLLFPLGLVVIQNKKLSTLRPFLIILLLAIGCTLIPAWLVIYVRLRYVVKLFPAIVVIVVGGCHELSTTNKWAKPILWTCGIGTLAWEGYFLRDMWQYSHFK
ncbi:hypothetical protein [Cyanobium sp. Cruz-8H5]|uniref:hypothetical protein n=1 Tax=Cyanobium sp. Cruz-8H5 TaxID=2823712 RepID=UPI0020CC0CBF|nr:hypothetical protein [Cyanobium sp. Cruz-8H5]